MSVIAPPPGSGRILTMGMLIIDEFEYREPDGSLSEKVHEEQIGGGGTYATIASRLFLPPTLLGMIIDVGTDFPPRIMDELLSYGSEMWHFREGDRLTTRALNIYSEEVRGFRYLTPRARISPVQLPSTPFGESPPSYVHFVCSPLRAAEIVKELDELEFVDCGKIWEPMPPDCVPAELENLKAIGKRITILSPNHLEALTLLSLLPDPLPAPQPSSAETKALISLATKTLASFMSPGGTAVVRSGGDGVCFCSSTGEGGEVGEVKWVEAVFGKDEQSRVIDVTGGGNGFLGGMGAGLLISGGDVYEGILYGSVAASFAIEQSGLPKMRIRESDGEEAWCDVQETGRERLERFRAKVAASSN
ncbi:Ribokinase-like protein [Mrakia frigida]|uniref:Ribokinase-like protein n=1 Tax=Mrakia frigida TaxID=29902 RepID=UPI003FCBFF76